MNTAMDWHALSLLCLLVLAGCEDKPGDPGDDADGDGFTPAEGDCDDDDAAISPEAAEVPGDGTDQNCDASDAGPVVALGESDGVWLGASRRGKAGTSVDAGADVDGDGLDDLLIGAPTGDEGGDEVGVVLLVHGPATPGGSLADADASMSSAEAYDLFGSAVASAGDVDGDGFDDVVVGASNSASYGIQAGLVSLGMGPDLSPDALLAGAAGSVTGTSMVGRFDVNGDGVPDLHIGSPSVGVDPEGPGRTDLLLGPATAELRTLEDTDLTLVGESALDYAGQSVGAGDVNGDGYDDLLVGAPQSGLDGAHAGRAYVVFGPAEGVISLAEADRIARGEHADAAAGASIAAAGDLDGDGAEELAVGAHLDEEAGARAGKVYVLAGGGAEEADLADAEAVLVAEAGGELLGRWMTGIRGADGEGALLIGAPREAAAPGDYPGKVYRLEGPLSGVLGVGDIAGVYAGASPGEAAGTGLSSGDLDGDGAQDVVIGAPSSAGGAPYGGAVYVSLGVASEE